MRGMRFEQCQAAIKRLPDFANDCHDLGIAYKKMGLRDQVLVNRENAVKLDPQEQGFRK